MAGGAATILAAHKLDPPPMLPKLPCRPNNILLASISIGLLCPSEPNRIVLGSLRLRLLLSYGFYRKKIAPITRNAVFKKLQKLPRAGNEWRNKSPTQPLF